jgi:hypothetical protein
MSIGEKIVSKAQWSVTALVLLFACFAFGQSSDDKFTLISSFPVKATSLSVDNFGNFYSVGDNQYHEVR